MEITKFIILGEVKNFENGCAPANIFVPTMFYKLTEIDLVLKDRECIKLYTKFNYFIATSYYM